jgi:hypothetical protein
VGATCNFAQYDNPSEKSAGEIMLTMEQGGAIAEITASRSVFSQDNAELNYSFYTYLFQRENSGKSRRLGDAMWLTKQVHFRGSLDNDLKYHLLGDPTLRLAIPQDAVVIDSLNGRPTTSVTALQSLGSAVVKGTVRNNDSTIRTAFNGKGLLEVFDARKSVRVPEWNLNYEKIGSVLYRGEVSVTNGMFQAGFRIPKDVSYSSNARVSFYAATEQRSADAVGFTENVLVSGTDSLAEEDTRGPSIALFFEDTTFAYHSGDVLKQGASMIAKFADPSGINTSTVGIGHSLELTISNPAQRIDLSDSYKGDLDTYREGSVRYQMPTLSSGTHTLRLKAWDTYNNSSELSVEINVQNSGEDQIVEPVNYPNPFSGSTMFTFQRSSTDPLDVEVKIYSVAGRLVRVLRSAALVGRFIQIPWDGTDDSGDRLANGVYLYKFLTKNVPGSDSHESIGKLAILR